VSFIERAPRTGRGQPEATAPAKATGPAAVPSTTLQDKLDDLKKTLSVMFPGREEQAEAIVVGLASGYPVFLMSPPGTAKTAMVDTMSKLIEGSTYFYYLLSQFTEPDELLGPVDVKALREGVYRRITRGKLPEANIVFLDEIFKASSAIRNVLLDIILNKRVPVGSGYIKIPMYALYTASNEVSDDEEDAAIYDRLLIRSFFDYVDDSLLEDVILRGVAFTNKPIEERIKKPIMTLEDVEAIQKLVGEKAIALARDNKLRHTVAKTISALRTEGIPYSDRRAVQLFRVIAALAMARKLPRPTLTEIGDALLMTAPMTPEHVAEVEEILQKTGLFASAELIQAIEQIVKEAEKLMEEYKQTKRVDILANVGRLISEALNKVNKAPRIPSGLRKRLENLITEYNSEIDKLNLSKVSVG